MPTVARILQLAPTCCYLSADYAAKRNGLFGGSVATQNQSQLIYMVYKVVKTIYDKDPAYSGLPQVANYLYELMQKFAFKAAYIVDGGGGGEVVPPSGGGVTTTTIYPFIITSADFEADGVSYNNANIVGDNLTIFVNQYTQQWLVAAGDTFEYTATGIKMLIPGFDANADSWTIMIQKLNS